MSLPLSDRVALVTGGGNGMGRSHAMLLAGRGADIIIQDIDAAGAAETARHVEGTGRRALALAVDIRDAQEFRRGVEAAAREIGGIDILINNAGISGKGLLIEDISLEIFDEMFAVHVRGALLATQAVIAGMKARRRGRIINISSVFSMTGFASMSHYAAAKSALLGFTKSWARELAPFGITVNAVAPGTVETAMTLASLGKEGIERMARGIPMGRIATPLEISYAVAWLAGDEAAIMTGQLISPSGGQAIVGI